MAPLVLVTRPEPQATQWAQALVTQGLNAASLPLMATQAPADASAVPGLWHALAQPLERGERPSWRALMFVSPAAVAWFFAQRPPLPGLRAWPAGVLLAAPGLGTAQALQEALRAAQLGPADVLHPPADAAQFDSEHLWPVLAPWDWRDQAVAILSGGDSELARGRQWLSQRWQAAGAQVHTLLTYQRGPGTWTPDQQALARRAWHAPADHIWLSSSSEALGLLHTHHLPSLWPQAAVAVPATPAHRLLVTHPRIAEAAAPWGWTDILTCPPTLDAVATTLLQRP
jgi:uroporphyrinogen-III synthase